MKKEVWDVLPRSAIGGAIGLLLAFGGFSGRQSIALGLILLIVFWIWERKADEIKKLREDKITPFSVTIHPNWDLLLTDNGLIDGEQWMELKQRDKYTIQNHGNYNVWHGISFTVLRRDLIYSNDHHVFFSRIDDISEPIEDLKTAHGQSPQLNIRINAGDEFVGYEIVMTPGKYFPDPPAYRSDCSAILPIEFFQYYQQCSDDWDLKAVDRLYARLSQFGWKYDGFCYEHKYAAVSVTRIR